MTPIAAIVWLAAAARSDARPGERFPELTAQDLTAQTHSTGEFTGRRTLVVAIADRDGAGAMQAWYAAADRRIPPNVARESLLSLHLPFFISTEYARSQARERVPRQYWHATLLDRGKMAERLGLEGDVPYVFALDEHGRIVAEVHGTADSPAAEDIWRALTRGGQADQ